jgi:predicted phage-related endonuclease
MKPEYHDNIIQGTDEWLTLRCGIITASQVSKLLTGQNKPANNATSRGLIAELAAQRITQYIEPHYISDDMLRGHADEMLARELYIQHYAPVTQTGIVILRHDGITLGASPDGLVDCDGLIEVKSRRQKYHLETILADDVPQEYMPQIQMQLLVTCRKWCDFISYCSGMPMYVKRVYRNESLIETILETCHAASGEIAAIMDRYFEVTESLIPTERINENTEII